MHVRNLVRSAVPVLVAAVAAASGCPQPDELACTEFDEVFVWADADGDGFGADDPIGYVCAVGANQATNNADCDDELDTVFPGAPELCDKVDNDCNDQVDEAVVKVPWFQDVDGDGFGDEASTKVACIAPGPDWVLQVGDCDDDAFDVNPAAREVCNGIDDDCDRAVDDADLGVDPTTFTKWYPDSDEDGFGDSDLVMEACKAPAGAITDGSDCDDDRASVNPGVLEVCNGRDDDCDTLTDDDDPGIDPATQSEFYADGDGDGYGDAATLTLACQALPGLGSTNDLDCDDTDPLANVDVAWYDDADGDGYGYGAPVVVQCLNPGHGLVPETPVLDCDDDDPAHSPATVEVCDNLLDENCDGRVDCTDAGCAASPLCIQPCADYVLPSVVPIAQNGNTNGQGNNLTPNCAFSSATDIAYQWTPPADGMYTIDLAGSAYDTVLYVLDGCGGAEVACNDDFIGLQSKVDVMGFANRSMIIVVDGYSSNNGAFTLNIN